MLALDRAAAAARPTSAGLSVNELKAEMMVEAAIVNANWRKNWPVMPLMNAQGTNTAAEHQSHGDHRPRDLLHGLDRGVARGQAVLDVVLHRLDDHDRVVHHDADRQHQAEQRQVVEAEAHHGHHREGADDGHGHGDQRDDGRAPVLQEQQHHEGHQDRWRRAGP